MKLSAMQILAVNPYRYLQQAVATMASTQPHHTSTSDNSKPQCSVGMQPETHPTASKKKSLAMQVRYNLVHVATVPSPSRRIPMLYSIWECTTQLDVGPFDLAFAEARH
ncbi:hypothetical protein PMIN03_010338 [Paraphaeosphaeria minitans]